MPSPETTAPPDFIPPGIVIPGRLCQVEGHIWRHIGDCNAGCACGSCSVPVHECKRCSDCDYGDNDEASDTRQRCAEEMAAQAELEHFLAERDRWNQMTDFERQGEIRRAM